MSDNTITAVGLLIPFIGSTGGAAIMYLMRGEIRPKVQKAMLGFASGVMIAASVWSLIIPSIEMSRERGIIPWLPSAVGFLLGIGFLVLLLKPMILLKIFKQKNGKNLV